MPLQCPPLTLGQRMLLQAIYDNTADGSPFRFAAVDAATKLVPLYNESVKPYDDYLGVQGPPPLTETQIPWRLSRLFIYNTTPKPPVDATVAQVAAQGLLPTSSRTLFLMGLGIPVSETTVPDLGIEDRALPLFVDQGIAPSPGDLVFFRTWVGQSDETLPWVKKEELGMVARLDNDLGGPTMYVLFLIFSDPTVGPGGGATYDISRPYTAEEAKADTSGSYKIAAEAWLVPMQYDMGPYLGFMPDSTAIASVNPALLAACSKEDDKPTVESAAKPEAKRERGLSTGARVGALVALGLGLAWLTKRLA